MNPCVRTAISGRPDDDRKRREKKRRCVGKSVRRRFVCCQTGKEWRKKNAREAFPSVEKDASGGPNPRFDARPSPSRRGRARPRETRRAIASARTVDRGHLLHRARHAGRVHDARAHLLACEANRKTFGGSSSEGRERSRLAYGIRCAFFRVPSAREAIGGRLARAHLPRRLCRLCRTRLRPGTGPTR